MDKKIGRIIIGIVVFVVLLNMFRANYYTSNPFMVFPIVFGSNALFFILLIIAIVKIISRASKRGNNRSQNREEKDGFNERSNTIFTEIHSDTHKHRKNDYECEYCGHMNNPERDYCEYCGARLFVDTDRYYE